MRKRIDWEWQRIDDFTHRAKVIGGWLVKCVEGKFVTCCFIADRDHEWEICEPYKPEAPKKPNVNPNDFAAKS